MDAAVTSNIRDGSGLATASSRRDRSQRQHKSEPLTAEINHTMLDRATTFAFNVARIGDALELLRSLSDDSTALGFFDPQFRELLERQHYGNEGERQSARARLPVMTPEFIDAVIIEFARVLKPSGYLMRWTDKYCLCEGRHLGIPSGIIKIVDLIATDNARIGQGYRSRYRGDFLLVMQKPPIRARSTWRDHAIPDRWIERVDRSIHPHVKPFELIRRLIAATTVPGDLVIDPAAGGFGVMHAALELERNFIGCDITHSGTEEADRAPQGSPAGRGRAHCTL